MSRISIDVSPEDHKKLKVMAALKGKSLKDLLLDGVLGSTSEQEEEDLNQLETLLNERIDHHNHSTKKGRSSAMEILEDVIQKSE